MRPTLLLTTLALAALASSSAAAQPVQTVAPTPVFRDTLMVPGSSTLTVETTDMALGDDTVVHLVDAATGQWLESDDDSGAHPFASRAAWTNTLPWQGEVEIWMHTFATPSGTADVEASVEALNGTLSWQHTWQDEAIGGVRVQAPGTPMDFQTGSMVGGPTDTLILALAPNQDFVAVDHDKGLGDHARIQNTTGVTGIIVASASMGGLVEVFLNDRPASDGDKDGLGTALEAALGSCDDKLAAPCIGIFDTVDSDRDGLSDRDEVFGIEDWWGIFPEPLRMYGADPAHKDVFMEIDYVIGPTNMGGFPVGTTHPFRLATAVQLQSIYGAGSANSIRNLDGLPGINLHFDVGTPVWGGGTLIGDFGGGTAVPPMTYQNAYTNRMQLHRKSHFRYGLYANGPGSGGQATGNKMGWNGSTTNLQPVLFAHEFGHILGLQHWGHDKAGRYDCKPSYDSLMNYADSTGTLSDDASGFVINPSSLGESWGIGVAPPNGIWSNLWGGIDSFAGIDWNRDGTVTTAGFFTGLVRGPAGWANWANCTAFAQNQEVLSHGLPMAASTPDIVRRGDYLYLFYVHGETVWYRRGEHSGIDTQGSCPGGDTLGSDCMTWAPAIAVPTDSPAAHVSAVTLDGGQVIVAYVSTITNRIRTLGSPTAAANGELQQWTLETVVHGSDTDREPELALTHLDPAVHNGKTRRLGLYWRDRNTGRYLTSEGAMFTQTSTVLDANGSPLGGSQSPTLADTPIDGGRSCGVFTDGMGAMTLHCQDPATLGWRPVPAALAGTTPTVAKPGLAWHRNRTSNGEAMRTGAYWVTSVDRLGTAPDTRDATRMVLTSALEPNDLVTNITFAQWGQVTNQWAFALPGAGVTLYEDEALATLKGAWVSLWGKGEHNQNLDRPIFFLPFADGTFDAWLEDIDDFQILERSVCTSLRGDGFCGTSASSPFGL